ASHLGEAAMAEMTRRRFVRAGMLAGVAAGTASRAVFGQAPAVARRGVRPVVIASANGNRFKNGGNVTCVQEAFRLLTTGTDVLDALITGRNTVERDPEGTSVRHRRLPNPARVVQRRSCRVHGTQD